MNCKRFYFDYMWNEYILIKLNGFYLSKMTYFLCLLCIVWKVLYRRIRVKYYIANCVSWVPRLALLDLQINWTYERTPGTGCVGRALTVVDSEQRALLHACFLPQSMVWVKARVRHSPRPKRGGDVWSQWSGTLSLLPILATPKVEWASASIQVSAELLLQYLFLISKDFPPLVKLFYITFNPELKVLSVSDWNTKDFVSHWSNQWHKVAYPQISSDVLFLINYMCQE